MRHRLRLSAQLSSIATTMIVLFAAIAQGAPSATTAPAAKEPGAAMILSTGDNLFYYKWFPIDSPRGVGASFDIFKSHYNVDRIVWRGAQAQWMARDNIFRPEPEETADLYVMEMDLETKDRLSHKAGDEARKRGLAYWGYMPLFEVGASAEAVAMAGVGPYNFEEKFRAEHPEYRLYDRAGMTSGGTIEFGYPEVRKAFLDQYDRFLSTGGDFAIYDGIIFYTYVENFFPRFSDQFIYSDVAAKDFKARYGADVYTQPFDLDKYLALRGEYVTQYLREMRTVFDKHGKKLAFYIDAREPEIPMRWPSYPDILVPGRVTMDWRTWVKEGLVDEIALRSVTKLEQVQPFLDAASGTKTRVSLLTNQMPASLRHLHDRGVTRHIWSPELPSEFPPQIHPASDLNSPDRTAVMSVLRQVRDGELDVPVEKIVALFDHEDLILRRQAVAAVLGRRMAEAIPALEKAAMDPENSFRCVVIDALGTRPGPNTVAVIGNSLEAYPVFQMRLVARTAWAMMVPERVDDLVALYRQTNSAYVRTTLLELPISKRAVPAVDAVPALRPLVHAGMTDANPVVRSTAAVAAGYFPDAATAELLLRLMDDPSETVQNSAAFTAGELARRLDDRTQREAIFQRLAKQIALYGEGSKRGDREWGYRVAMEALIYGFGPRGERHVVGALNGPDTALADRAWRVLFHPNDGWNFYAIDREPGEALYAFHPKPNRANVQHKTYTPPARAELLNQTFAGIEPDPTGVFGNVWSPGGKWTGLDAEVRFATTDGKPSVSLGVGKTGKGSRLVGTMGYDLSDKRFKNRLRGHFPASPVAYGVGDGVAELSLIVRKSDAADALEVSLRPDSRSEKSVGFTISKDGRVQPTSGAGDAPAASSLKLAKGTWQRLTLRLDFNTGKAALLSGDDRSPAAEFPFDTSPRYRAVVLSATGDAGTSTHVGELRWTQAHE
jgi:HEAT repeat protein